MDTPADYFLAFCRILEDSLTDSTFWVGVVPVSMFGSLFVGYVVGGAEGAYKLNTIVLDILYWYIVAAFVIGIWIAMAVENGNMFYAMFGFFGFSAACYFKEAALDLAKDTIRQITGTTK